MNSLRSLWVYSSAKPESGYHAAVTGYAHKIASRLSLSVVPLASDTEEALLSAVQSHGAPQVIVGAGESLHWQAHGLPVPVILKARPYQDQHGNGPSMHPLTLEALASARDTVHGQWSHWAGPSALLTIANPPWLVTETQAWVARLQRWLAHYRFQTLLLSASPRTNPLLWEQLEQAVRSTMVQPVIHVNPFDASSPDSNRYLPMLATADAVMIWGCSRSMAGEAALTGKPVFYAADHPLATQRFISSVQELPSIADGRFVAFEEPFSLPLRDYSPVDVTQAYVAKAIAEIEAQQRRRA